jgi:hypothetical protein
MDMKELSLGMQTHAVSYLDTKVVTYHAAPSFRSYLEDGGKILLQYFTNYLSNFHSSQHNGLQIIVLRSFNTNHNRKKFKISFVVIHPNVLYEGHLESKERFDIKKYLLMIGKKKNMQVLSHTFTYFST